jgi:ANTAR domain/GAF domain
LRTSLRRLITNHQTCLRQHEPRHPRPVGGFDVCRIESAMSAQPVSGNEQSYQEAALASLAASAAGNIPGVDLVSITVRDGDRPLYTAAATDALAEQADALQYELREGPCYAAVTDERFVIVNDMSAAVDFPRYGPRVVELGLRAQAAIQLVDGRRRAGLNLYARTAGSFDRSTVQFAELFATQAGSLLGYAEQVEQLSEGLHTRTDIGTAVGIVMERYSIDRHQAFAFLARHSQNENTKLRVPAQRVIDGTFAGAPSAHRQSRERSAPDDHHRL